MWMIAAALFLCGIRGTAAQPPEPAGVCAFNSRDGAATVTGVATIALPFGNRGVVNVPAAIAATGSTPHPFIFILIAPMTGPEDALFGWAISQNATAQTLYAWTNDGASGPTCNTGSVALPGFYVPGFSLCGGDVKGALWPAFQGGYTIGGTRVNTFSSPVQNCAWAPKPFFQSSLFLPHPRPASPPQQPSPPSPTMAVRSRCVRTTLRLARGPFLSPSWGAEGLTSTRVGRFQAGARDRRCRTKSD